MKFIIALVVIMFATIAYAGIKDGLNEIVLNNVLLGLSLPVASNLDELSINGFSVLWLFGFALVGFSLFVNRRKL